MCKHSALGQAPAPRTCWLAGSCLFQVVECLVVVTQVVKRDARPVECLEVLSFFLQHLEAVLLDALVVDQLGLEQAGCRGERQSRECYCCLSAPASARARRAA